MTFTQTLWCLQATLKPFQREAQICRCVYYSAIIEVTDRSPLEWDFSLFLAKKTHLCSFTTVPHESTRSLPVFCSSQRSSSVRPYTALHTSASPSPFHCLPLSGSTYGMLHVCKENVAFPEAIVNSILLVLIWKRCFKMQTAHTVTHKWKYPWLQKDKGNM